MKMKLTIWGIILTLIFQDTAMADKGVAAIIVNCMQDRIILGNTVNPDGLHPFSLIKSGDSAYGGDIDTEGPPEFSFYAQGNRDAGVANLASANEIPYCSNPEFNFCSIKKIQCPGYTLWGVVFSDGSLLGCGEGIECFSSETLAKKEPKLFGKKPSAAKKK